MDWLGVHRRNADNGAVRDGRIAQRFEVRYPRRFGTNL